MEQQIRRTRLPHGHGKGYRGEPREGRCSWQKNVPLLIKRIGKRFEFLRITELSLILY